MQKASGVNGAERHLLTLLPALARRGFDVAAWVMVNDDGPSYVRQLRAAGVEVTSVAAGPDANPVAAARLVAQVRRHRPDLLHSHLVHGDVYGTAVARVTGVPLVSSVHGCPAFLRRPPLRAVGRAVARNAAHRIAISTAVASFLDELGLALPGRLTVIPYGIDQARWAPQEGEVEAARRSYGVGPDEVVVGVASRLIAHKGHDVLVDAMALVRAEHPHARLMVAGTGPLEAALVAQARDRLGDGARFLGFVDDVRTFMLACDVIAFPTAPEFGEGFGLAALEAMAAARPVVGTPFGAIADLVVDGECGLIVPPNDPPALARALASLVADGSRRAAMGEAATARAATRFSLEAMVDATAEVYREVAPSRTGV